MLTISARILKVFTNPRGEYGNGVGVVFDENHQLDDKARQEIAKEIGFSESVFVNNLKAGDISIFSPIRECPNAGHALIGTSWLFNKLSKAPVKHLLSSKGKIITWQEGDFTWIRMKTSVLPKWNYQEVARPDAVEDIHLADTSKLEHMVVWSWVNQERGIVRARTFATDWGIPEDQGNGSGSMRLATNLGRKLEIHHGDGSIIYAHPAIKGFSEVGGRVVEEESREIAKQVTYLCSQSGDTITGQVFLMKKDQSTIERFHA